MSSMLEAACEWAASLQLADIPEEVRDLAVAPAISAAGAAEATLRHPVSRRLVGAVPRPAHTHAVGATVRASVILGLSAEQMACALGLALAQPRRVLLPAFMASDAKFWVAAIPILDAARCVQLAQDRATGLTSVLEAPGGLLAELAERQVQRRGCAGDRWP